MAVALFLGASLLSAAPHPALAAQDAGQKATAAEVKKEVVDAAEAIKHYSAAQRDQAVKKVRAALDDLDARIERLEASIRDRWGEMDRAARERASAALRTLKQERERVAEWTGGLQHGSAEAWGQVKRGFSKAYGKLKASWEKADQELGSGK
jgi:hypothetical protein